MDNIPEVIDKIHELTKRKSEIIQQYNEVEKEIRDATLIWQSLCEHPATYIKDGRCSACGAEVADAA